MSKKTFLHNDREHTNKTHYRWYDEKLERNRNPDDPDFQDEWIIQQYFKCQFYIKLRGVMGMNWGACSNPDSTFDSRVMYEHDGCEAFEAVDDSEL